MTRSRQMTLMTLEKAIVKLGLDLETRIATKAEVEET